MSPKKIVPLGVELKSEQKNDVLSALHRYVPIVTIERSVPPPGDSSAVVHDEFFQILIGGDQMTSARTRACQRIRVNSDREKDRLQGVVGVSEDWHAKMCFLGVVWNQLYIGCSGMDGGTMYHRINLINRRNDIQMMI